MIHDQQELASRLDAELPQTQCTRCGYSACRPYAEAMASGKAKINQCPPGGTAVIRKLAELLQQPFEPLNPANGVERPREIAHISEQLCIGCTLCIHACPVDAIAGGPRSMHTVVATLCTGCALCLPPCPVDCIVMLPVSPAAPEWDAAAANAARNRFERRNSRLQHEQQQRLNKLAAPSPVAPEHARRSRIIRAALLRARHLRDRQKDSA
jgi:electron transport complex protein RnfB